MADNHSMTFFCVYNSADNEINGLAFRKLSEATLLQMGFKWGTAQNILDIMSSLSAEVCFMKL